jgi:hypothetical protein
MPGRRPAQSPCLGGFSNRDSDSLNRCVDRIAGGSSSGPASVQRRAIERTAMVFGGGVVYHDEHGQVAVPVVNRRLTMRSPSLLTDGSLSPLRALGARQSRS